MRALWMAGARVGKHQPRQQSMHSGWRQFTCFPPVFTRFIRIITTRLPQLARLAKA
jgi:hypothetical protein